jgi:tetratricopeptide (TPR) repeat protein
VATKYWYGLISILILIVAGAAGMLVFRSERAIENKFRSEMRRFLLEGNTDRALQTARRLNHANVDASRITPEELMTAGALCYQVGGFSRAEEFLKKAAEHEGPRGPSLQLLMQLLRLQGRNHDLLPLIHSQLLTGICPSEFLFVVAWPHRVWIDDADRQLLQRLHAAAPDELLLQLATRDYLADGMGGRKTLLKKLIKRHPGLVEPYVQLGRILCDQADLDALTPWEQSLPKESKHHPEIWFIRGQIQQSLGHYREAVRCFGETLRLAPWHYGATYGLSQILPRTEDATLSESFSSQSSVLSELERLVVYGKGTGGLPDESTIRSIVEVLEQLGRRLEAEGWCRLYLGRPEAKALWAQQRVQRRRENPGLESTVSSSGGGIVAGLDLSKYPLPRFDLRIVTPSTGEGIRDRIRFEDVAENVGIHMRYENGATVSSNAHMHEISGGGLAVLDYDLDSWPDLYLTQGGAEKPPNEQTGGPIDRLYRNLNGRIFTDVTELTGITDSHFGQGAAAGDYNNDGWVDIFVANIGLNRLFINNGDGTFSDLTSALQNNGDRWTMSAAIADVTRDAIPDIYAVNYLSLSSDVLQRLCKREGQPVQCRPTMFPAEPDTLLVGVGDGHFIDQSAKFKIPTQGKGMGVIVGPLGSSHPGDLFVSNDTTPNHLLRHRYDSSKTFRLFNEATTAGVALGGSGETLACMGVAAGDVNGDGLLDLFVTNFSGQPNNLYIQQADGLFEDHSRSSRLYTPSLPLMGWGAQFLDANLDGYPELVVANGHLEDYSMFAQQSRMSTQVFQNHEGRIFREISPVELGPYFEKTYFGRAVARLDWNRDGLDDICVSHVDAPTALLENQTKLHGHFLAIDLVGTVSARDPVGTVVKTHVGEAKVSGSLCAGDGFQCSNQHHILLGVGNQHVVSQLVVTWPSGDTQTYLDIPADITVRLIEGRNAWFTIPR